MPRRTHATALLALAGCCAAAGCGVSGGHETARSSTSRPLTPPTSSPGTQGTVLGSPRSVGTRAAAGVPRPVCAVVTAATVARIAHTWPLRARASSGGDRSTCAYSRGTTSVRVVIDGGAGAARRYADFLAEAVQLSGMYGVGGRPQSIRHVGDDRSATAGAYWSPSVSRLTALGDGRLARVTVAVPERTDGQLRKIGERVTHLVLVRLAGTRGR